jgi:hypothetical protein
MKALTKIAPLSAIVIGTVMTASSVKAESLMISVGEFDSGKQVEIDFNSIENYGSVMKRFIVSIDGDAGTKEVIDCEDMTMKAFTTNEFLSVRLNKWTESAAQLVCNQQVYISTAMLIRSKHPGQFISDRLAIGGLHNYCKSYISGLTWTDLAQSNINIAEQFIKDGETPNSFSSSRRYPQLS